MAKMKKAADGYTSYGSKASKPSSVTDYAGKASKPDSYTQYKKGGVVKKAQNGIAKMAKKDPKEAMKKGSGLANNPLFKKASEIKDTTRYKKAKSGGEFGMLSVKAGVDNNPNPTAADRIAGAKKKAMKMGGKAAKQAAIAIAMKKEGKTPKKKIMKNGGMLAAPTKGGVSMQLGSYTRQIGKNYTGKNVVNKGAKAKMGKSVGKCKNGC